MPDRARHRTVYEPSSGRVPPVPTYLHRVWERRSLVWHLARTDMKARHYDTILGKAWLIVDPIVMALTYYLVRVVLFPGKRADAAFFIAHIIMGVSFFFFVRDIVEGVARSIVSHRVMVLNTAAPTGVFPAVVLTRALFDLVPTLVVYLGVHVIAQQPLGFSLLLLPVIIVLLTAFALGLGLLFAPMVVFFRDTGTMLGYAIRIWLYLTPVMYAVAEIPPAMTTFFTFNPLFPFFRMFEAVFAGELPDPGSFLLATAWAVATLWIGGVAFLRRERDYATRL